MAPLLLHHQLDQKVVVLVKQVAGLVAAAAMPHWPEVAAVVGLLIQVPPTLILVVTLVTHQRPLVPAAVVVLVVQTALAGTAEHKPMFPA